MSSEKKEDVQEVPDEELPETPIRFVTIAWDEDGDLLVDCGDLSYYEAVGVLDSALQEVKDRCPMIGVRLRSDVHGAAWAFEEDDDYYEDDEEDE